jgi:Flp pilus assembly protein TadG
VLITGLLLSIALIIIIGAAVDIGHAFIVRRELASIADDSALTGSQAIDQNALHVGSVQLNPGQARASALAAIAPATGQNAQATATTGTVSVHVQRHFPTILLRIIGLDTLTVSAQATATPRKP